MFMYLFGGFEGVMLADLYKYSTGKLNLSLANSSLIVSTYKCTFDNPFNAEATFNDHWHILRSKSTRNFENHLNLVIWYKC